MPDPFELSDQPAPPPAAAGPVDPPYFTGLNAAQREAVETLDGPVLVLAGAGTGKTRVLTTRLAHLLMTGKARPFEVVAVTFTNKAAREMKDRVAALLGRPVEGWWLGTFHALGARILRAHAEAVGLKPNFTILDADDQLRLLKQVMEPRHIDDKKWPARTLLAVIQRWKDRGLTPDKVSGEEDAAYADGLLVELYQDYQARLLALNAADFGDLLLHCLTLFTTVSEILANYQRKFRYLLVDEYQDTNVAQYLWLRLLAQEHRNICCVGDDDQSIYSWRGAEVGNILKFEKDFEGAGVIRLEQNYRSTPHILGAASGLIAHNEGRLGKTLWTGADEGQKVGLRGVWDGEEEARVIGEEIETRQAGGQNLDEMAVLVRAGFQTREFEERLITLAIPYRVIGGPRFYERLEIRDAIAYFRVTVSSDDDLAFERIVNVPKRGLGQASLQAVHHLARARGIPLYDAAAMIAESDELRPKVRASLRQLIGDFERWRANLANLPHSGLAAVILEESGYTEYWMNNKSPEAPGRLENLKELVAGLEEFENLQGFLEHVSLVMDIQENGAEAKVNLMTLHSAKGLEFDTVFLPGWEEGLFPHQRSLDEEGLRGLEEERRLAYVGLTRARREALITHAANRRIYNQWQNALPSRFIGELPEDHIEQSAENPLLRSGAGPGAATGNGRGFREAPGAFEFTAPRRAGHARDGTVIEGEAWLLPAADSASRFLGGARVFHQKFGYGRVLAADGNKLEVAFDKAGTKKVIDSFVEPA
ncbi:MAG: UvrD-helicase domain-containing protein [Rhodospirillales bacterium]|jgi:DNA helicase-2/ATP-dependent DNA helicase PcrA|nr:DNA helicase II [Rhodospirillaceae bacterium]MDP6429844.1 UvrD-helicase domain-containing protein [Rhodospirillales bacterium]MDP6643067.1 UvrD-helicase domain-containing protein [Rhodospirillales bacterium]MDP6841031.1 UvrD-helicase domain-containing protein [Rhodospirillales bacterium]|tara:strand:- start:393 stop:2684 length:2292 start_codon:yes stop_codon:yes gene_type:complete